MNQRSDDPAGSMNLEVVDIKWASFRRRLKKQPDGCDCESCSRCEAPGQGRRLSIASGSISPRTHDKAKSTCWESSSSQMRQRLAAAGRLHAIPCRVTPTFPREDRGVL